MTRHHLGPPIVWAALLTVACDASESAKPTETGWVETSTPTTSSSTSTTTSSSTIDGDGDGFSTADGDCDDANPDAYPGADERCDGIDNDCDKDVDEDATDAIEWYIDEDEDNFGLNGSLSLSCPPSDGLYALIDGDCDDTDADIHVQHLELPGDGVDSNCDDIDGAFVDVHPGTLQLDTVADQQAFCSYYTSVAGALYLPTSEASDLNDLSDCLEAVSGTVEITSDSLITAKLDTLQSVGGHLVVEGATSLEELVFPQLERVERDIYINDNPDLVRLEVWDLCEVLNLSINQNPNLETVTMPSLVSVTGNLALRNSTWMSTFDAASLTHIEGDLILRDLNAFERINLPVLERIGPSVTDEALVLEKGKQHNFLMTDSTVGAIDMPNLLSISGDMKFQQVFGGELYELRSLRAVGGDVKVINTGLEQFNFKDLTHVGGELLFEQNFYLNDLGGGANRGLGSLAEVGGDFTLTYNHTMTSMAALFDSMTTIRGDYTVTYNAELPESQAFTMADTVSIGGDVEIFGNFTSSTTATMGTGGSHPTTDCLPTGTAHQSCL